MGCKKNLLSADVIRLFYLERYQLREMDMEEMGLLKN